MTAKITFIRIDAQKLRINATIDIDVSGLDEIWPHRIPGNSATRVRVGESGRGNDAGTC
jgi:hypothetical protein